MLIVQSSYTISLSHTRVPGVYAQLPSHTCCRETQIKRNKTLFCQSETSWGGYKFNKALRGQKQTFLLTHTKPLHRHTVSCERVGTMFCSHHSVAETLTYSIQYSKVLWTCCEESMFSGIISVTMKLNIFTTQPNITFLKMQTMAAWLITILIQITIKSKWLSQL